MKHLILLIATIFFCSSSSMALNFLGFQFSGSLTELSHSLSPFGFRNNDSSENGLVLTGTIKGEVCTLVASSVNNQSVESIIISFNDFPNNNYASWCSNFMAYTLFDIYGSPTFTFREREASPEECENIKNTYGHIPFWLSIWVLPNGESVLFELNPAKTECTLGFSIKP